MKYEIRKLKGNDHTRCESCRKRKARLLVTWYGQWAVNMKRCVRCALSYIEAEVSNQVHDIAESKRGNKCYNVGLELVKE